MAVFWTTPGCAQGLSLPVGSGDRIWVSCLQGKLLTFCTISLGHLNIFSFKKKEPLLGGVGKTVTVVREQLS